MDPKGVEGINRLYKQGDIRTEGKITFAPTEEHMEAGKGMSNEAFFERYASELLGSVRERSQNKPINQFTGRQPERITKKPILKEKPNR